MSKLKLWMTAGALAVSLLAPARAADSAHAPEPEPGEIPPDAGTQSIQKAELVALPAEPKSADKKTIPTKAVPAVGSKKPMAKPATLSPASSAVSTKKSPVAQPAQNTGDNTEAQPVPASRTATAPVKNTVVSPTQLPPLQSPNDRAKEAGYGLVLQGVLEQNTEAGPEQSPVLIRGLLVIPEKVTLTLKPGTVVHLVADPNAKKPVNPGEPDATQSAVIWVWGSIQASGHTGDPVELANHDKIPSSILFYGRTASRFEGVRLRNCGIVQNAGTCHWTNSEFLSSPHIALAAGSALFTHCSFRNCGGLFATYQSGSWSLLARKCVFASCREGIVLASDPGEARLIIEKNHFLNTRGAHIRAMNLPGATPRDQDYLIGENWYGTPQADEVDIRIVDRRQDPNVKARLNIRPPADKPYAYIGGGVPTEVQAASLQEQDAIQQKLLSAHANPSSAPTASRSVPAAAAPSTRAPTAPAKSDGSAAMNRTIRRPKSPAAETQTASAEKTEKSEKSEKPEPRSR